MGCQEIWQKGETGERGEDSHDLKVVWLPLHNLQGETQTPEPVENLNSSYCTKLLLETAY